MSLVEVRFRVDLKAGQNECVCLSGNVAQLGNWQPRNAVPLEREDSGDHWSVAVPLPVGTVLRYRYALCVFDELPRGADSERKIAVVKWETHMSPRTVTVTASTRHLDTDVFGIVDGRLSADRGWLTDQSEVVIKLYNNPIHLLKRSLQDETFRMKCRPVDLSVSESLTSFEDDDSLSYDQRTSNHHFQVLSATLRSVEEANPHEQNEYGEVYRRDDYLIFRAQTFHPETTGFIIDIYISGRTAHDVPRYMGHSYLLPHKNSSATSVGTKTLPITGLKNKPVGQLSVEYLYISPLEGNTCDFRTTYARYWNSERQALDIGHRGMGTTKPRDNAIPENTIASFNKAGETGADYVEFDVQLSKDRSVVVYHDFHVCLTMKKKSGSGNEFFPTPVKDLSLEQLQRLKLDHAEVLHHGEVFADDEADQEQPEDWQTFPTLKQVFERVDPLVGFDIEIKYPMALAGGNHELEHFFEHNLYIDTILRDIFAYAAKRRILITCFDPDICSLIRAKQSFYPVVFTCMGMNGIWPPYGDLRAQEFEHSVYYSLFEEIVGISAFYNELVKNMDLFQQIKDEGLLLFVWGNMNDRETIKKVKSLGVHGLIYDRISELKGTDNVFRMEEKARLNGANPNTAESSSRA